MLNRHDHVTRGHDLVKHSCGDRAAGWRSTAAATRVERSRRWVAGWSSSPPPRALNDSGHRRPSPGLRLNSRDFRDVAKTMPKLVRPQGRDIWQIPTRHPGFFAGATSKRRPGCIIDSTPSRLHRESSFLAAHWPRDGLNPGWPTAVPTADAHSWAWPPRKQTAAAMGGLAR